SPSCGCGEIYDGTFSGNIIKGDGITASLLKKNKIKVISGEDLTKI
ncbi:purine-nucleoside phosphorylase, partial [Candidatus Jorgensenbacteria bacterium CG11_big_fil_rev_8_21_14_0_20_38_23]